MEGTRKTDRRAGIMDMLNPCSAIMSDMAPDKLFYLFE